MRLAGGVRRPGGHELGAPTGPAPPLHADGPSTDGRTGAAIAPERARHGWMDGMDLPERYTATSRLSDRRPDDSRALSVRVGEGPTDWYHGVPGFGFVGTHAVRFDGTAARGVHRVLLHDVDLVIAATTELSYVIGYRLDDDLRYVGGHVAVDVVLSDGTRASAYGGRRPAGLPAGPGRAGSVEGAVPAPVEPAPGRSRLARRPTGDRRRADLGRRSRGGRHRLPRPAPAR